MMKMYLASALLAAAAFLAPLPIAEQHAASDSGWKRGEAQAAMVPAQLENPAVVRVGGLDESAGLDLRGPEPTTAWFAAAGLFAIIVLRRTSSAP
jgi:hypothetical protein